MLFCRQSSLHSPLLVGYSSLEAIPVSMLQTILYYHIIPPHVAIDALWTTPFFIASDGNGIPTALPGIDLSFSSSNADNSRAVTLSLGFPSAYSSMRDCAEGVLVSLFADHNPFDEVEWLVEHTINQFPPTRCITLEASTRGPTRQIFHCDER